MVKKLISQYRLYALLIYLLFLFIPLSSQAAQVTTEEKEALMERNDALTAYFINNQNLSNDEIIQNFFSENPNYAEPITDMEKFVASDSVTEALQKADQATLAGYAQDIIQGMNDSSLISIRPINDEKDLLFYSDGHFTVSDLEVTPQATNSKTAANTHNIYWFEKHFARTYIKCTFHYDGKTVHGSNLSTNTRILWDGFSVYHQEKGMEYTDSNKNVIRAKQTTSFKHIQLTTFVSDDIRVSCNMNGKIFKNPETGPWL